VKDKAIVCEPQWAAHFCDIVVADNCNAATHSGSLLGHTYANDTDLGGEIVLTGSYTFIVKEIEVFEITD
jgi:hypothetical protein